MRLTREDAATGPLIRGFAQGGFRVDDGIYRALLLTPERADGWEPPAIEALDEAALAPLLALDPAPEFLLLGTGAALVRPPAALIAALAARDIGIEAMDSRAAARAWGVLRGEGRWIAGAFYPL
ncbi:MTH938/NDUFAF3 family protein [Sphingomonas sp. GlSt437]|uniref:MTH938/NDUFAF3 family protein n=1 Tax=Sphingomonas sp. GlSt437 TaxID=3389970 RepID=UPI003A855A6D